MLHRTASSPACVPIRDRASDRCVARARLGAALAVLLGIACSEGEGTPEAAVVSDPAASAQSAVERAPIAPPQWLLLVTVDSLRRDRVGTLGSTLGLTPNFDALAARSTLFTAAYTPAPVSLPAIASLMTGRYPESLGVISNTSSVPAESDTLAEILAKRGFQTAAVVSSYALRGASGIAAGFERYDDAPEVTGEWPGRSAVATTDAALSALDGLLANPKRRGFLWVHYSDPRGPYAAAQEEIAPYLEAERAAPDGKREVAAQPQPDGLRAPAAPHFVTGQREYAFYRAQYDAAVARFDAGLGRLLAGVSERGLDASTWILVAGAHGQALGEKQRWLTSGTDLENASVRIPLLLHIPELAPGRRSDVVSLVDVVPTVLTRALTDSPELPAAGSDLLNPPSQKLEPVVYFAAVGGWPAPRHGVAVRRSRFVEELQRGRWRSELQVRRRDGVYRIASAKSARAATLRTRLGAIRQTIQRTDEVPQSLSEDELARLRALGHLGSEPSPPGG